MKCFSELKRHVYHRNIMERKTDSNNQQRRKIIALFAKMGYVKYTPQGKRADMNRIHSWVEKYGYLKNPLNSYNKNELPRLVSQVEKFYKKYLTENA